MSTLPSTRLLRWLLVAVVIVPLALFTEAGFATYNSTREANDWAIQRSVDVLAECPPADGNGPRRHARG